jgi:hypothetical protein
MGPRMRPADRHGQAATASVIRSNWPKASLQAAVVFGSAIGRKIGPQSQSEPDVPSENYRKPDNQTRHDEPPPLLVTDGLRIGCLYPFIGQSLDGAIGEGASH